MDGRRKTLGRRIKRARVAAGHRSQKAFAEAIGVHETSVARAETGSTSIGDNVYGAIENGLGWPEDCISQYLETGDESLLPSRKGSQATPTTDHYPPGLRDDPVERKLWDIKDLDERARWRHIYGHRTEAELARKIARHGPPLQPPGESTQTEQFG